MTHTVLLGSKSVSRKKLLEQAEIPFLIVEQNSNEQVSMDGLTLSSIVSHIALEKMNQVVFPAGTREHEICFALTADTVVQDMHGTMHGKPIDKDDVIAKLKLAENGLYAHTAICLDRRVWDNGQWKLQKRIQESVKAHYIFSVPEHRLDEYMQKVPVFSVAGATAIEGFGKQFLRSVTGSYSAIVGLPMYELYRGLEAVSFFD